MAAVLVPREDGPHQSEPGMLPSWLLALRELCGAQVGQQRFQHRPETIIGMQGIGQAASSLRCSHHSQHRAPGSRSDGLLKPLLRHGRSALPPSLLPVSSGAVEVADHRGVGVVANVGRPGRVMSSHCSCGRIGSRSTERLSILAGRLGPGFAAHCSITECLPPAWMPDGISRSIPISPRLCRILCGSESSSD